jgi:hypothetical protein
MKTSLTFGGAIFGLPKNAFLQTVRGSKNSRISHVLYYYKTSLSNWDGPTGCVVIFCEFGDVDTVGEMVKNKGLILHHPFHYAVQPYIADARFCAYQTSFIPVVIGFRYHRFQAVRKCLPSILHCFQLKCSMYQ